MDFLLHLGQALIYCAVAIAAMYGVKLVRGFMYIKNANTLIEEENNLALAFRQSGVFIGIALAMFGAFIGADQSFFKDLIEIIGYAVMSAVLLTISLEITNRIVLNKVDNNEEVKKGNVAVGLVEFGACIATGLVAMGAFSGTGSIWTSIGFFLLGQVTLIIMVAIYEFITPFVIIKEVEKNNVAAGLILGAMQIAIGFILYKSIEGDFVSWEQDLVEFGKSALTGILMIAVLFNSVIDKLFLPNTTVKTEITRDKNSAALLVVSAIKIALAIIICGVEL